MPVASPEEEQSVLGAILLRPRELEKVADILTPQDFYREAHRTIYQVMVDLYNRDDPVDLVSVINLLKERGQYEKVGGPLFLSGLSEHVGIAANADHYAYLVYYKAVLRRLQVCSQ
jgi:replicative DNA helicase